MKEFDVCIVGGGASGLMCALNIPKNKTVAIFDSNFSFGKKLLATGNGRCNLTNANVSSSFYNRNIDRYLSVFDNKKTIKYFNDLGLLTFTDNEGRVYPYSNSAKSVVDVLNYHLNECKNITKFANTTIIKIEQNVNKYILYDKNNVYCCKKVVIATCRLDENVLTGFDIKLAPLAPSLVALKTKENTKQLDGIRLSDVLITASCNGHAKTDRGEVLFKAQGLSGIAVFNLSCIFSRSKCYNGKISIDLMPYYDQGKLKKLLEKRLPTFNKVKDLFNGVFVDAVRSEILSRAKIEENRPTKSLKDGEIADICNIIKHFDFDVVGCYDNNQVISGGVSLDDLSDTMEHKKYRGLYFIGEVVDVDGECGGYNLQWAWTSGYIAGKNI